MRIQLLYTSDQHTTLSPGATGTVVAERDDPWGRIVDVNWDNGSTLSLVWGVDAWKVLELDVSERTDIVVS